MSRRAGASPTLGFPGPAAPLSPKLLRRESCRVMLRSIGRRLGLNFSVGERRLPRRGSLLVRIGRAALGRPSMRWAGPSCAASAHGVAPRCGKPLLLGLRTFEQRCSCVLPAGGANRTFGRSLCICLHSTMSACVVAGSAPSRGGCEARLGDHGPHGEMRARRNEVEA